MLRCALLIPCLALCFCSCEKPKATTTTQQESDRPKLPQAATSTARATDNRLEALLALNTRTDKKDQSSKADQSDILAHPWVKLQTGLTHTTHAMIDDITSLRDGHEELNKYRAKTGLPTTSFDDESKALISTIQEIQTTLDPLKLKFPPEYYSVLNIPATQADLYRTPLPFQVYKRVEMGETDLGIPFFLDVRVFDISGLQGAAAKAAAIQSIINWHVNLLQNGAKDFTAYASSDALALIGHGDRDRSHFDGGHGFATKDRGVFLAFMTDGKHLFVLNLDAPWKNIEDKKTAFLDVLNRQLKPWSQPISAFRFSEKVLM